MRTLNGILWLVPLGVLFLLLLSCSQVVRNEAPVEQVKEPVPAQVATPTPTPTPSPTPTPMLTPTPEAPSTPTTVSTIRVNVAVEGALTVVIVGGMTCKSPCTLDIAMGAPLIIEVRDPPLPTGSMYVFVGWSDGGERRHEVRPTSSTTYIAYFND